MLRSECDGQPRGVEMMGQPVVSRSQRRIERKQLVLIFALILAVAGVSFSLGVMYGLPPDQTLASDDAPNSVKVTQVAPPSPPQVEVAQEKPEILTFYENLPKGNQAPLGSGINLPPEQPKKSVHSKPKIPAKPVPVPAASLPEPIAAPAASANGSFVVQVASFRTGKDAKKLATRLDDYKLATFVESADLGEKGLWYRVLAGPFSSREDAARAVALLKEKERLSALIRQR
jgi:DedD protein